MYVVLHRDPHFTGYYGAVDFCNGQGSTNSAHDVVRLVKNGCTLPDPKARAEIRALAQRLGRARRKREAERAAEDARSRTPEGVAFLLAKKREREEPIRRRSGRRH